MKSFITLAIVAMFAGLVLSSCKKDYTCHCTYKDSLGLIDSSYNTTINDSKDNAKTTCENGSSVTPFYGDTITIACAIQ